jgi:hypothetical protein
MVRRKELVPSMVVAMNLVYAVSALTRAFRAHES